MKRFSLAAFAVISFLVTSCKTDSKKTGAAEEEKPAIVEVAVTLTSKDADVMTLYYKDNSITYYVEDMAIYKNLKAGKQELLFELPEDVVPNDFRFDISTQSAGNVIEIESIEFRYMANSFKILNQDLAKYFNPNEFLTFDIATRKYETKKVDGKYDPFLTTTGQFYPEYEKMIGYKIY